MTDEQSFQERMATIEVLTRAVDRTADPAARAAVKELMEAVMDLHGTALRQMLELIHERESPDSCTAAGDSRMGAGEPSTAAGSSRIIDRLGQDPLIGSLLILYGLHPLDLRARVSKAMERLAPEFRKHGVEVEVARVEDTTVRLRVGAVRDAKAARALKKSMEDQIYAFAPDVTRIEGLGALGDSGLVTIESLASAGPSSPHASPHASATHGLEGLAVGEGNA